MAASSVADGVDGLHVAPGDIGAWADAMTRLTSDELARRFSEAAFRSGAQLLGRDDYTDRLIEIYEKALSRKRGELPHDRSAVS